jgi:CO/xanthine dehydrogenase Mo-binding subunit
VTGRARFGADMTMPGMLWGWSAQPACPRAHQIHRHLQGTGPAGRVHAVVTGDDFDDRDDDLLDIRVNVMARGKALYDGHAVAAVAATSRSAARKALKLIKVDYEPLPHVTDVDHAMEPDAPVIIRRSCSPRAPRKRRSKPSNIADASSNSATATSRPGLAKADVVIERTFKTEATHQGYIEPHACVASYNGADGTGEMWVCTQGHFMVRNTAPASWHGPVAPARHRLGNRRRLRRQDHGVHRTGGADAVEEVPAVRSRWS